LHNLILSDFLDRNSGASIDLQAKEKIKEHKNKRE
jgi:hypothetical protein